MKPGIQGLFECKRKRKDVAVKSSSQVFLVVLGVFLCSISTEGLLYQQPMSFPRKTLQWIEPRCSPLCVVSPALVDSLSNRNDTFAGSRLEQEELEFVGSEKLRVVPPTTTSWARTLHSAPPYFADEAPTKHHMSPTTRWGNNEASSMFDSNPESKQDLETAAGPITGTLAQPQRRWGRFLRRRRSIQSPSSSSSTEPPQRQNRARQLSSLLANTAKRGTKSLARRQYAARTITGLINALAVEVEDLDVAVQTRNDTPLHRKHIETVSIEFSRLGFKPLRFGGHDPVDEATVESSSSTTTTTKSGSVIDGFWRPRPQTNAPISADEAFNRMDADNSGYIDRQEMIQALRLVTGAEEEPNPETKSPILERLASELFRIYDKNGDGVVDRGEYKSMVDDMALLRRTEVLGELKEEEDNEVGPNRHRWLGAFVSFVMNTTSGRPREHQVESVQSLGSFDTNIGHLKGSLETKMKRAEQDTIQYPSEEVLIDSPEVVESVQKSLGSITFTDVKMDLRRLLFGAVPILKRIVPGGPLILEPFTATIAGSFNREDIMKSALLDAGLRRLVMRALRKRVGFLRDFMEGSFFRGRSWKTFGGEGGPVVEIPRLSNVEFENDKLIVTGRARVRTRPDSPILEQKFKVRTSIGSRKNGRFVRLEEPELALVIECPEKWEETAQAFCDVFDIAPPSRPKPLYSFFPIYSPFKLQDDDGFDLGSDNAITSLYIQDGALRFEMSAVLRPGRFLGSHYIAFTTPIRTLIVTLDRVTEGMRAARKIKKAKRAETTKHSEKRQLFNFNKAEDVILARQDLRAKQPVKPPKLKSFFSRFVDGYLQAEREDSVEKERVTNAIRDFFGRQGGKS